MSKTKKNIEQSDIYDSDSSRNDFYAIDKIYVTRINPDGKEQYFVSWIGFPPSENCWIQKSSVHGSKQTKKKLMPKPPLFTSSDSSNNQSLYQFQSNSKSFSSISNSPSFIYKDSTCSKKGRRLIRNSKIISKEEKSQNFQINKEYSMGIRAKILKNYPQYSVKVKPIYIQLNTIKQQKQNIVTYSYIKSNNVIQIQKDGQKIQL